MRDLIEDLYRSRKDATSRITVRHELVVASPQAEGPLQPPRLLQYAQDGYLRVQGLFSAEETARLEVATAQLRTCDHVLGSREAQRGADSAEVHTLYGPHRFSDVLADAVHDGRLAAIARQILGTPCYVHQARVSFRSGPARDARLFRSDFETWHVEDGMARMRALSIVLSISDSARGPLRMICGSHRQFLSCPAASSGLPDVTPVVDPALIEQLAHANGVSAPELPRGSALVVDCNLLQAAEATASHRSPITLTVVYNSVDNPLLAPFSGKPARPTHLAQRTIAPL